MSKPSDMWSTPSWVIEFALTEIGNPATKGFALDACCVPETAKAPHFYTEKEDGLAQPWLNSTWCNPPYSNIRPWLEKAVKEQEKGVTSVSLLNADHTTKWYKEFAPKAQRIDVPKRVKFIPPPGLLNKKGEPVKSTTNPFPSMLLIFSGKQK